MVQVNTELGETVVANLGAIHRTLDVLLTVGDLESAASIAKTVGEVWRRHHYYDDGAHYLSTILEAPGADRLPDDVLVTLYDDFGHMNWGLGRHEQAEASFKRALANHIENPRTTMELLANVGMAAYQRGEYDIAATYYERVHDLARALDSTERIVLAQEFLGSLAGMRGNIAESRERLKYAHALSDQRGYRIGQALSMNALGELERSQHNYRQAADYYQASATLFGAEHPTNRVLANGNLAFALLGMGEAAKAEPLFEQGYRHWEADHAPYQSSLCLIGLAGVRVATQSYREAARLVSLANQRFAQSDARYEPADRLEYERVGALIRAHVSADELRSIQERVAREERPGHIVGTLVRNATTALLGEASALSSRELEMLSLIAQGLTDRQIAVRCHISLHTVNSHLRAVYRKLSVNSRSAALHAAHLQGVL
jgi:ATP/maltotriose-dependent transcriptional regulator MalT